VLMKTVSGVQPVDVIVRRVEGAWCDSLELRSDSLLGVPGLVDVVRNNRVAVANSLGAGVLETAALPAFLPGLCRQLLNEDLAIPSVATWWCGHEREKSFVLENLDNLIVRSTFADGQSGGYRGWQLSSGSKDRLRRRIEAHPEQFTAREPVARGTTPVLENGKFVPREYVLRVYLVGGADGWTMLPGGLARMGIKQEGSPFNMQSGGESKDVWVRQQRTSKPIESPQAANVVTQGVGRVRRSLYGLPSRVADNLFWLGRYSERTEGTARSMRIIIDGMTAQREATAGYSLLPFFQLLLPRQEVAPLHGQNGKTMDVDLAMQLLVKALRDRRNPSSLVSNIANLQRVASNAKERLSAQLWQQIQRLGEFQRVAGTQRPVFDEETMRLLEETLESLSGLCGLANENMTRGEAWSFLELGRRLERTDFTARLLKESLERRLFDEEEVVRQVLLCADSGMSYRRRYLNHLHCLGLLDLLLVDRANPRSVAFQLDRIGDVFRELPRPSDAIPHPRDLDRLLLRLTSHIGLANLDELLQTDNSGFRHQMAIFLSRLLEGTTAIGTEIEHRYFAHAAPLQALSSLRVPI